jgi:PAS domain S-box-containing protein
VWPRLVMSRVRKLGEEARIDIEDRKWAEEQLRDSEHRWRSLTEALPQLVWAAMPDGACDYFSAQWTEYTGIPESELLGWRWMDVLHPDDREPTRQFWTDSVAGRSPYDVEYRVRRQDGEYGWFKTRGVPVRDSEGKIVKWFGTCTDITDRKRAEEALRDSEQELRKAHNELEIKVAERTAELESSRAYLAEAQRLSHTGSFGWRVSTGEILWSEETLRIFEYDPTAKPTIELILQRVHPDDAAFVKQTIERAAQNGKDFDNEYRLAMPDGSVKYVHIVAHALSDESGSIEFVGAVMDTTKSKRAEEALRRSESYLAEAQRLAHAGSWAWGVAGGDALHLSEEWYRIYGFDPEKGTSAWEEKVQRIHPEDRDKWQRAIDRAIGEKLDYEVEMRILLPDGTVKYIHTVGHPVLNASGNVVQFVGSSMDISNSKRAEEAQADLAHVSRVTTMGELTASLAHEVKQPIAAAITNAKTCLRWLSGDTPNIEEARAAAMRIVKDQTRAAEIISRIRLLFKKDTPLRELVEVNEVIREMIVLLRGETTRYSISVWTELAADLSPVMGDRVQLQQVMMNLMVNGIEAMKDVNGTRELIIKSQRAEDEQLLVSVSDTGVGLPPQQADQIFNSFFTTKPHGTGMGLRISRSIVESHGGRLWAADNSPRGASFYFNIPTNAEAHE